MKRFLWRHKKKVVAFVFFCIVVVCFGIAWASSSPSNFPRGTIVRINKNVTIDGAASYLKEKGIVRYAFFYKTYVLMMRRNSSILAGSYLFDQPESALRVAYRTVYGINNLQKVKITFKEGLNSKEMGAVLKKNIPAFNVQEFLVEAQKNEGYLFPETYFFNPDVEPQEVIREMRQQFEEKTAVFKEALATSTRSFSDIVIMASLLEEEANNSADRAMISDVLWKRIDKGMALQVDVPFYYIFNKVSRDITRTELATTSLYNTYKNKGLTPGPITNPGISSLRAALYPKSNPYYFYLADSEGVTHFAKDHDGHVVNIRKYLR
jgi:UPF0755 protein